MKIIFKLNILGIRKDNIKKVPWLLGAHAFSIMLFFIFLSMALGIFIFYNYVILVETKKQEIAKGTITFTYDAYQEVLKDWGAKDQVFQESFDKKYLNPFSLASESTAPPKSPLP